MSTGWQAGLSHPWPRAEPGAQCVQVPDIDAVMHSSDPPCMPLKPQASGELTPCSVPFSAHLMPSSASLHHHCYRNGPYERVAITSCALQVCPCPSCQQIRQRRLQTSLSLTSATGLQRIWTGFPISRVGHTLGGSGAFAALCMHTAAALGPFRGTCCNRQAKGQP